MFFFHFSTFVRIFIKNAIKAILPRLDDDFDRALDINRIMKEKIENQFFKKTHYTDLSYYFVDKNGDPKENLFRYRKVSGRI